MYAYVLWVLVNGNTVLKLSTNKKPTRHTKTLPQAYGKKYKTMAK